MSSVAQWISPRNGVHQLDAGLRSAVIVLLGDTFVLSTFLIGSTTPIRKTFNSLATAKLAGESWADVTTSATTACR